MKFNIKRILAIVLSTVMCAGTLASCGKEVDLGENAKYNSSANTDENKNGVKIMNFTAPVEGEEIVVISFRGWGDVKIKLFPEYAPKGVQNFVELAKKGYYDGLGFHRIINGFMIQGGDPKGNGTGGESIWGEKFDGGTSPNLIHVTGALAYANSGSTSTNGSQFYIVTGTKSSDADLDSVAEYYGTTFTSEARELYKKVGGTPFLDGNYTVFGQIFEGLEIVNEIQKVSTDSKDRPYEDVIMESVKVISYDGGEVSFTLPEAGIMNFAEPVIGEEIVVMEFEGYGTVKFKLFPEIAPKAVENFIGLVNNGYYDGLTFHRIINDFMIQGGDPKGNGTGGESFWGGKFDGGTSENLIHVAGALAYANSGSTSTNGSQFYIVTGKVPSDSELDSYKVTSSAARDLYKIHGGTPHLDGGYTVFGQVIEGFDIIKQIQKIETDASDAPIIPVVMKKVYVEKFGVPEISDASEPTETTPESERPTNDD